jgi:hypothetical protein
MSELMDFINSVGSSSTTTTEQHMFNIQKELKKHGIKTKWNDSNLFMTCYEEIKTGNTKVAVAEGVLPSLENLHLVMNKMFSYVTL